MQYQQSSLNNQIDARFAANQEKIYSQTDRMFAILMVAQWIFAIVLAYVVSPLTWAGDESSVHIHVYAAVFMGGALAASAAAFAWAYPGRAFTRHLMAANQLLMSALLIHITGGRTTTHFHIFGSLAFLAFYRDWKVIITATVVTAGDHLFRGLVYPQSIFGIPAANLGLVIEHASYVIFEDVILVIGCLRAAGEAREGAAKQVEIEIASDEMQRSKELAEKLSADSEEQKAYLSESVEKILRQMSRFSEGDLGVRLEKERDDKIGELADGFNQAVSNTRALLRKLADTTSLVANHSNQISNAAQQIAARAEEQSARSITVNSEAGEMRTTAARSDEFVRRTLATANENGEAARDGSRIVGSTVEKIAALAQTVKSSTDSVEKLAQSSDEIGKILKVINDIANQTNMLAINAAIEAARAGEHGESFSVVATQVRALASDTRGATERIGAIIETIQHEIGIAAKGMRQSFAEVEEGLELTTRTQAALSRILGESESLLSELSQLENLSTVQAASTESVTNSVAEIADATAESAENVTEIASSTSRLHDLSEDLRAMTQRFKFDSATSPDVSTRKNNRHGDPFDASDFLN